VRFAKIASIVEFVTEYALKFNIKTKFLLRIAISQCLLAINVLRHVSIYLQS